jgi:hypothetical protein
MDLFGFIQWCFRSSDSAALTIIVGWLVVDGLAKIVAAARGRIP